MSSTRVDLSPVVATRKRDISSWVEGDVTRLNTREKKRYNRWKKAIRDYFTSDSSLEALSLRYHFSVESLEGRAAKCLMQHEDGKPWGYRALLPRVNVVDHAEQAALDTSSQIVSPVSTPKVIQDKETQEGDTEQAPSAEMKLDSTGEETDVPLEPDQVDDDEDTAKRQAIRLNTPKDLPKTPLREEQVEEEQQTAGSPAEAAETVPESATPEIPQGEPEEEHTPLLPTDEVIEAGALDDVDEPVGEPEASTAEIHEQDEPEEIIAQEKTQTLTAGEQKGEEDTLPEQEETQTLPAGEQKDDENVLLEQEEASVSGMALPLMPNAPHGEDVSEPTVAIQAPDHPVEVPAATLQADGHSKHLPVVSPVTTVALAPFYATGQYRIVGKKGLVHHSIRKRRVRSEEHRKKRSLLRIVSLVVVLTLLLTALIPVGVGVAAYSAYTNIKGVAMDGVNHLLAVKSILPTSKTDITSALDAHKLQQAQLHFTKAESDFLQLQSMVNRPDVQSAVRQFAPQYGNQLGMAQHLVQVALDVSRMGNELSSVALLGANTIHGSPLSSSSNKPLITTADITNIEGALTHAQYYINDISTQMSQVSLASIPISASQKAQLSSVLDLLPKAQDTINQVQGLVGIASWLLGVGHQRRFLVQTMDRAELRPAGGFTGQYGILQIQNGRMSPFNLQDVNGFDYAGNGFELGRQPPPQYSWMNFGNWGLRDANLSADYPTNAHLVMQVFQQAGGGPVDGSISFTPVLISQILQVTGPIHVASYNETITAQNLEDRLHFYQQDFSAIAVEQQKTGTANSATRKAFTRLLGQLLMDRVKHMQVKQLMQLVPFITKDLQSRDLGIYFNDPAAEAWLVKNGYSGAFTDFSHKDGFAVVQANISISKASQYVHTTEQDQVVLDAQGGATHTLTITLDYNNQLNRPIYGIDTYTDYLRVYAPANAQFISGSGFDTQKPLCTPSNPKPTGGTTGTTPPSNGCSQFSGNFPTSERYCPSGNYSLGTGYVPGKGFTGIPVDALGGPTQMSSDLPGYSMWGGLTRTPKNCISYITLSWYVPHVVNSKAGQSPYSIIVDKQGGMLPTVDITVDTSALPGVKPYSFKGDLNADKVLALALRKK